MFDTTQILVSIPVSFCIRLSKSVWSPPRPTSDGFGKVRFDFEDWLEMFDKRSRSSCSPPSSLSVRLLPPNFGANALLCLDVKLDGSSCGTKKFDSKSDESNWLKRILRLKVKRVEGEIFYSFWTVVTLYTDTHPYKRNGQNVIKQPINDRLHVLTLVEVILSHFDKIFLNDQNGSQKFSVS